MGLLGLNLPMKSLIFDRAIYEINVLRFNPRVNLRAPCFTLKYTVCGHGSLTTAPRSGCNSMSTFSFIIVRPCVLGKHGLVCKAKCKVLEPTANAS